VSDIFTKLKKPSKTILTRMGIQTITVMFCLILLIVNEFEKITTNTSKMISRHLQFSFSCCELCSLNFMWPCKAFLDIFILFYYILLLLVVIPISLNLFHLQLAPVLKLYVSDFT